MWCVAQSPPLPLTTLLSKVSSSSFRTLLQGDKKTRDVSVRYWASVVSQIPVIINYLTATLCESRFDPLSLTFVNSKRLRFVYIFFFFYKQASWHQISCQGLRDILTYIFHQILSCLVWYWKCRRPRSNVVKVRQLYNVCLPQTRAAFERPPQSPCLSLCEVASCSTHRSRPERHGLLRSVSTKASANPLGGALPPSARQTVAACQDCQRAHRAPAAS